MTFTVTIDHRSPPDSDHSSVSDEEGSSGVQVSPPSGTGSQEYTDYDVGADWAHLPYPDEIKPSDSASRPRTLRRNRNTTHNSRSTSSRRYSRRDILPERDSLSQRPRRHHSPESPGSVDSAEEFVGNFTRQAPDRRFWPPGAPGAVGGYAQSSSSGPSYNVYPHGGMAHVPFGHPGAPHPPSDQLVRLGHLGHMGRSAQYNSPPFGYSPQYPQPHPASIPPFFGHDHQPPIHSHHHPRHPRQRSRNRSRGHSPQEPFSHPVTGPGNSPYGGPQFSPPDLIPYGANGYYQYNQSYPVVPGGMVAPQYFGQFPHLSKSAAPSAASQSDTTKDEAIARLEKLIIDERVEREAREVAREAALAKAAADKAAAEERAVADQKIAEEAAAKATAIAKAEAEEKAAEDAAKAKKAAEDAAAAAAAEAKKAAEDANKPPPEKKKPIKFKDAVGRKFSFPFHLCSTWQGMEELIRQAFLHVEVIGPHVAEGHYDLVGPNGDIILPQVWETVIEPDWTVTMHMWPIPEKPKDDEPPPPPAVDENAIVTIVEGSKKKSGAIAPGPKKPRQPRPDSRSFAMWMVGSNRPKTNKALKVEKKA